MEFLTDSTLGRIWYEMMQGRTKLTEACSHLVRRPDEVFFDNPDISSFAAVQKWLMGEEIEEPTVYNLANTVNGYRRLGRPDQKVMSWMAFNLDVIRKGEAGNLKTQTLLDLLFILHRADHFSDGTLDRYAAEINILLGELRFRRNELKRDDISQEKILNQPFYVPFRKKKDPRDIKLLDPAGGSGHFLLYAFDLFLIIYEEAWFDEEPPESEVTGHSLRSDYPKIEDLRLAIPGLILRHNLHGIDIDPRAAQIASLSLWMRAQRAYNDLGIPRDKRPPIRKTNFVVAEPMPGEKELLEKFIEGLNSKHPRVLGDFVRIVFAKMKLAGEAGSLLKIEDEIHDSITEAKEIWQREYIRAVDKRGREMLFSENEMGRTVPRQPGLFDVSDTDEEFWNKAETLLIDALQDYARHATNKKGFQRRLFAEDVEKGFAFIDLCRKYYDVVLMNPPFGEFSKPYKAYSRIVYPNSYNDILGAFVERWLHRLVYRGRLGAITSRTCFFLTSFTDWRKKVILAEAALAAVADLGQGVMDNAMVEAAAYILERSHPTDMIPFIRAIAERDREAIIREAIAAINSRTPEPHLLLARQDTFRKLADAPFVYWAEPDDLDRFATLPTFEPEAAEVRVGLQTGDDPHFVRAVWEVPPQDTQFVYYPTNGDTFCRLDDPIILAYYRRRHAGMPRWAFHVKSGASQPWYSPITLKINWHQDGLQLRNFRDSKGKLRSRPQNIVYYYRPGFSWTRRAARLYPYVVPGNCIPSVSRYMAFPEQGREYDALGISASRIASAFMRFYGEKFEWPNFLVENLKMLPWAELKEDTQLFFHRLIQREVEQRRRAYMNHEPFHEFLLPIKVRDFSNGGRSLAFDPKTLLGEEGERLVAEAYELDPAAVKRIERDVIEALEFQHGIAESGEGAERENGEQDYNEDTDFVLDYSEQAKYEALLSYCIGCIFGRWDIRITSDQSLAPKLPADPFSPLPVCPPGMLLGPDGLPSEPGSIVSEEWLRARQDANTLPLEGTFKRATITDHEYPLDICWDGILVDDPGHPDDVITRIRRVYDVIWKEKTLEIFVETIEILDSGKDDLRPWFRANFFAEHITRYTKSRRKAPIYWCLSTPSRSYAVWLYYHRFSKDTLYKVLHDYVSPKIQLEERKLAEMRVEIGDSPTTVQRRQLANQEKFVAELNTFHEEIALVAPLWKPDLNDGVIINFSLLWRLAKNPSSWQRECRQTWDALVRGDYDWAQLAMHLWPERVIPKCLKDRSLAIAHGLEESLWQPDEDGKWHPRDLSSSELDNLISARSSRSVKAALEKLLSAPVVVGNGGRRRRG